MTLTPTEPLLPEIPNFQWLRPSHTSKYLNPPKLQHIPTCSDYPPQRPNSPQHPESCSPHRRCQQHPTAAVVASPHTDAAAAPIAAPRGWKHPAPQLVTTFSDTEDGGKTMWKRVKTYEHQTGPQRSEEGDILMLKWLYLSLSLSLQRHQQGFCKWVISCVSSCKASPFTRRPPDMHWSHFFGLSSPLLSCRHSRTFVLSSLGIQGMQHSTSWHPSVGRSDSKSSGRPLANLWMTSEGCFAPFFVIAGCSTSFSNILQHNMLMVDSEFTRLQCWSLEM